jgi:hypothetical protein
VPLAQQAEPVPLEPQVCLEPQVEVELLEKLVNQGALVVLELLVQQVELALLGREGPQVPLVLQVP